MNIALLGFDSDILALAVAAKAARHSIVQIADPGDGIAELRSLAPSIPIGTPWESLIDHAASDVILVGHGVDDEELRAEQLRRLANEGRPLLVAHPVVSSLLVHYEIDMIARDAGGFVRHYVPSRRHPALDRLASMARGDDPRLGKIEQLAFERPMAERGPTAVTRQFARDVDVLRILHPKLRRISALGADASPTAYANLAIQLTGPDGPPIRWSVVRFDGEAGAALKLEGERGRARLTMHADCPWQIVIEEQANSGEKVEEFDLFDSAQAAIDDLETAMHNGDAPASTWSDAVRAMELADSIEISLRRSRAIEVHSQEVTESTIFRGRMATFGCFFLLVVPLIIGLAGMIGDGVGGREIAPIWRMWPQWILGISVLFLLFQFLPRIFLNRDS